MWSPGTQPRALFQTVFPITGRTEQRAEPGKLCEAPGCLQASPLASHHLTTPKQVAWLCVEGHAQPEGSSALERGSIIPQFSGHSPYHCNNNQQGW